MTTCLRMIISSERGPLGNDKVERCNWQFNYLLLFWLLICYKWTLVRRYIKLTGFAGRCWATLEAFGQLGPLSVVACDVGHLWKLKLFAHGPFARRPIWHHVAGVALCIASGEDEAPVKGARFEYTGLDRASTALCACNTLIDFCLVFWYGKRTGEIGDLFMVREREGGGNFVIFGKGTKHTLI